MTFTPSVSSLYRNIEVLAARCGPRSRHLRLGLRWGFGLPLGGRGDITEYSFPSQPSGDLPGLLRERGGLAIGCHDDPAGAGLDEHLRAGRAAVAVVDSYHLPYRPAFGRVHSSRTIIVEPGGPDHVLVDDCWEPAYRGPLRRADLEAARRSHAVADPALEPVYSGVLGPAQWFTVDMAPFPVTDPACWARETVTLLATEFTTAHRTEDASFGLAALRELVGLLAGGPTVWEEIPRRTLALTLRAELGSRRYLCALLHNALLLAGEPALVAEADRYQEGLRHLQAARDVQIKTLRRAHPSYDAYVLARCRDALANEERLLAALAGADLAPVREEVVRPWLVSR